MVISETMFQTTLAANRGEIKVKAEIAFEMKIESLTFRDTFLVLEPSEAGCLLGLDFLDTHKRDPLFSEIEFEPRYISTFPSNSTGSVLELPSHESSYQRNILHTFRS